MAPLAGKNVLVAGGTGNIGREVARHLLAAGATVVVPSRARDRLERLGSYLAGNDAGNSVAGGDGADAREAAGGRLHLLEGDLGTVEGAERVRDQVVAAVGGLDGLVAAVGGWRQGGPLWEVATQELEEVLRGNLLSHWAVVRTFIPVLAQRPGSTCTFVGGDAAEVPVAGAGPACMAAAAQLMMMRTLVAEVRKRDLPVRVNELVLSPVRTPARAQGKPEWLTSGEVGELVTWLASDAARMVSGAVIRLDQRPPVTSQP